MITVFNASTMAASTYSIEAIDAIEIDGELRLVTDDGLLAPDHDGDLVDGVLETGFLALGVDGPKRMPNAILRMSAATNVEMIQKVEMYGRQDAEYSYRIIGVPAHAMSRHVRPLGRGVQADYAAFRVSGFDEIDAIEIEVAPSLVNR
jgi:hypothetical protein